MTQVLVQVVTEEDREIGWGSNLAERLDERLDDVRRAVALGAAAVSGSVQEISDVPGWRLGEVVAKFGVTLTAEAGAILTKGSVGATFEVTLTYRREP
jgi:Trypsin-co-occurring domain 1